jgi:hypothetical protein
MKTTMIKSRMTIYEFKNIVSKLSGEALQETLDHARVLYSKQINTCCEYCHAPASESWTRSRRYCNNACKQKAWRSRSRLLQHGRVS